MCLAVLVVELRLYAAVLVVELCDRMAVVVVELRLYAAVVVVELGVRMAVVVAACYCN